MYLLVEVCLFAGLLGGLVWLWVRVSALERQASHLRDQLDRHIMRGHGQLTTPPSDPTPSSPLLPPPPSSRPNRPIGRRVLRLVKN